MTDYYIGGFGADDASHGLGPGSDAFLSLEYALEDGGLVNGDTLYLEHDGAGAFAGDVWKSGTNYGIIASTTSGTGRFLMTSIDDTAVVIDMPADTASYLLTTRGDWLIRNVKFTNSHGIFKPFIQYIFDTDLQFQDAELDSGGVNIHPILMPNNSSSKTLNLVSNVLIRNGSRGINTKDSTTVPTITIGSDCKITDMSYNAIYAESGVDLTISGLSAYGIDGSIFSFAGSGYSYDISNSLLVKQSTETTDYIFEFDDVAAAEIYAGTAPLTNIVNNILWFTHATISSSIDDLVYSPSYDWLPLPASNRFVEPDGDATGGWSWPTDEKTNPAISSALCAFFGDSIMRGTNNTDGYSPGEQFDELTSDCDVVDKEITSAGGLELEGGLFLVDYMMTQVSPAPMYVFVSIGINNEWLTHCTDDEIVSGITSILQKIKDYGAVPIWLGLPSKPGNPPDNTAIDAKNATIQAWCETNGVCWGDLLSMMELNPNWKTDYWDDLTSNLHPNDSGAAFYANYAMELLAPAQGHIYIDAAQTAGEGYGLLSDPAAPDSVHLVNIQPGNVIHIKGDVSSLDLSGISVAPTNPSYTIKGSGAASLYEFIPHGTNGAIKLKSGTNTYLKLGGSSSLCI